MGKRLSFEHTAGATARTYPYPAPLTWGGAENPLRGDETSRSVQHHVHLLRQPSGRLRDPSSRQPGSGPLGTRRHSVPHASPMRAQGFSETFFTSDPKGRRLWRTPSRTETIHTPRER
ncbi:hypothetical protein GCM10009525_10210 [Streptosporangium amethystogenes subsp. fukuiense]